ncbi:MAG TPA: hypothetical protein VN176_09670 [Verrucomicrobiae bacterium]|jgi:hypothetical protein|nr:hypothetical protein [Verrucomicrobiae bacterium]
MGILDRFFNPIWYKASKLDIQRQRSFAIVVVYYDFYRLTVEKELVAPVEALIRGTDIAPMALRSGLAANLRAHLAEEALVGLFRCCTCPQIDPNGKLPSNIVQSLAEVWGTFALADINHRLKRNSPRVLEETHYSKDADEARTQLLLKWMEVLGITSPSFVTQVNRSGFLTAWHELVQSSIGGLLLSFSKTPDEVVLSKARSLASDIPWHRRTLIEYFIDRLATMPLTRQDESADKPPTTPQREQAVQPKVRQPVEQAAGSAVEFLDDGRAVMRLSREAGPVEFMQQMVRVFRRSLKPEDMLIAARWAAKVTGKPVKAGRWEAEHEEAFVRGYERFCWEGNLVSGELQEQVANIKKWLHDAYPVLHGSPLDVALDEEIRGLFRRMLGGTPFDKTQLARTEAAAVARATGRDASSAQVPPEMLERGRFHCDNNFKNIGEWERKMVGEFGSQIVQILPRIWNALKG